MRRILPLGITIVTNVKGGTSLSAAKGVVRPSATPFAAQGVPPKFDTLFSLPPHVRQQSDQGGGQQD